MPPPVASDRGRFGKYAIAGRSTGIERSKSEPVGQFRVYGQSCAPKVSAESKPKQLMQAGIVSGSPEKTQCRVSSGAFCSSRPFKRHFPLTQNAAPLIRLITSLFTPPYGTLALMIIYAPTSSDRNKAQMDTLSRLYLVPLERIGLSKDTMSGVKELGIYDVAGLLNTDPKVLFEQELIGRSGLYEIYLRLEHHGIAIPPFVEREGNVMFDRAKQPTKLVWAHDSASSSFADFSESYFPSLAETFYIQSVKNADKLSRKQKIALEEDIRGTPRAEIAAGLKITQRTLTNIIIEAREVVGMSTGELKAFRDRDILNPARRTHNVLTKLISSLGIEKDATPDSIGYHSWREVLKASTKVIKTLPPERARALKLYLKGSSVEVIANDLGMEFYKARRFIKYAIRDLQMRFKAVRECEVPLQRIPKEEWVAFSTPERRKIFAQYVLGYSNEQILKRNPWLKTHDGLTALTYSFRQKFELSVEYLQKRRAINKALRIKNIPKEVANNLIDEVFPRGIPASVRGNLPRKVVAAKVLKEASKLSNHPRTTLMFKLRAYGLTHNEIASLLKRTKGTSAKNIAVLSRKIRESFSHSKAG